MLLPARWRFAVLAPVLALATSCAEPPTKELSLAEGAIEAARAAGAAEFATVEFTAAEQTLARARADVTAGDYRAALGHALDANTRAQAAANAAAEGRVKARLAADETLDALAALIERVEAQLASEEAKRVPAANRRRGGAAVKAALARLATARAAVERGELAAVAGIREETTTLEEVLAGLTPPPQKRSRPRR